MKQLVRSLCQSASVGTLTVSLITTGFVSPAQAAPAPAAHRMYSGETIFKGVLLDDGPLASTFPEIWNTPRLADYREQRMLSFTPSQREAQEKQLIAALNAKDPQFFGRFAAAMQSGNRLKITSMLTETGERLQALNPKPDLKCPSCGVAIEVMLVLYIAVAVAAIVAAVAAFDPAAESSMDASLQRDVLVNLIAERLHATS